MKLSRCLLSVTLAAITLFSTCFLSIDAFASELSDDNNVNEEKTFYLGDIDRDGKVSAGDARSAMRMSVALEEYDSEVLYYGDYIEDGKITAADARLILRTSVALEQLRAPGDKLKEPPKAPEPTQEQLKEKWLNSFPSSVSYDDLESNMYWMVNDIGVRNWWSSSQNYAGNLIYDRLISYGYSYSDCKKQDFYYGGTLGRNIIAKIPTAKSNPDIILVMAHYDTVRGTGGAVDNSSGTVALLQTAKLFKNKQKDFGAEIRFLFTAGEEQGYYGAYGYLNSISAAEKARHKIVFNIDMAAKPNKTYSPTRAYYLCVSTEPSSSSAYYSPAAKSNIGSIALDEAKKTLGNLGEDAYYSPVRAGYHDIIPFRKVGLPALTLSWRCYDPSTSHGADYGLAAPLLIHTATDNMYNVDLMSLYNTTRLITLACARLTSEYIEKF